MTAKVPINRRSYDFCDLPAILLEAGMAMLEKLPDHELGLRPLARDICVSATAVRTAPVKPSTK